jgi:hypothetical protein
MRSANQPPRSGEMQNPQKNAESTKPMVIGVQLYSFIKMGATTDRFTRSTKLSRKQVNAKKTKMKRFGI